MTPLLREPFFQVTLPIMFTLVAGVWAMISTNNRRLDDLTARLGRIEDRLTRIEEKLDNHGNRITALEERTSLLRRS